MTFIIFKMCNEIIESVARYVQVLALPRNKSYVKECTGVFQEPPCVLFQHVLHMCMKGTIMWMFRNNTTQMRKISALKTTKLSARVPHVQSIV